MTIEAPARAPATRSLEVSPTTATSATSSIRNRRTAVRIMSGQGRPPPAAAGGEDQVDQALPSEGRDDPVPGGRGEAGGEAEAESGVAQSGQAASAPGMAHTSPRSTAPSKAASNAELACSARRLSPPSSSVNTVILD